MAFSLAALIARYGYVAVAVGAVLEGESVLLAAGAAAHHGLLHLPAVIAIAAVASTLGDQAWFQIGRRWGTPLLIRLPPLARRAPWFQSLLDRHHTRLILAIRFLIGLRIAGPVLMGWARIDPIRFAVLNAVAALLWAVVITSIGYGLGNAWTALSACPNGRWLIGAILAVLGAVLWHHRPGGRNGDC